MARLIGMKDLAPAKDIFVTQFKPVPTQGVSLTGRIGSRRLSGMGRWPSRRMQSTRDPLADHLVRLALLALVLGAWELLPRNGIVNPLLLPPLSRRAGDAGRPARPPGRCTRRSPSRRAEVIVAFIIAVPLGAAVGILIAENDYLGEIFKPMLFYVFSIPKSIFLPMFILVFGIGFQQKVAYAAFTTAFVVLMSATAAVESVRADHIMVARSYGATQTQILLRVYVPSMMPILLETLRISMIFNFTGVMIAEMYASRTGIGHLIANWGENFQMPQLFAGVILLAAVAIAVQRGRARAGGSMQHVANLTRAARPDRRRRRSRSSASATSMPGRDGGVPALEDISMTVGAGPLRGDRRPERLRQDLAADDDGRAARTRPRARSCATAGRSPSPIPSASA